MIDHKENISIYMDDEASEFESASVLKQLKQDTDLRTCWESYHLIGDAIRSNLSGAIPSGFSKRLLLALEDEPAHMTAKRTSYRRANNTSGFALAASVSAVAIVGLLQFSQPAMLATATNHYETDIQQQFTATASTGQYAVAESNNLSVAFNMNNQALAYASFDSVNQIKPSVSTANLETSVYDYLVNFSQYSVASPLEGSFTTASLSHTTMY